MKGPDGARCFSFLYEVINIGIDERVSDPGESGPYRQGAVLGAMTYVSAVKLGSA